MEIEGSSDNIKDIAAGYYQCTAELSNRGFDRYRMKINIWSDIAQMLC